MPKMPSMTPPPYYNEKEVDPFSDKFNPDTFADLLENSECCEADTFEKPVTANIKQLNIPIKSLISGTPVDTPDSDVNEILENLGIKNPNTFFSDKEIKASEKADRDPKAPSLPIMDQNMINNRKEINEMMKK